LLRRLILPADGRKQNLVPKDSSCANYRTNARFETYFDPIPGKFHCPFPARSTEYSFKAAIFVVRHSIGLFPRRAVREFDTESFMINRPNCAPTCRRTFALAMYCCALVTFLTLANQSLASDILTEGSSSKQHRKQTVNSIPYHQLNQLTKEKITGILEKPSIYRQLPVTSINVDPDYFRFLVRYPEVIVNIWQMMGVTKMSTKRTGPYSLSTNDGAGTISSLELVYGTDNLHIFYGTGSYEGPILKR
jgi:hypothetical protein